MLDLLELNCCLISISEASITCLSGCGPPMGLLALQEGHLALSEVVFVDSEGLGLRLDWGLLILGQKMLLLWQPHLESFLSIGEFSSD